MRVKIKEAKKYVSQFLMVIAQHVFLTGFIIFLISLIIGGILFYKYIILAQRAKPETVKVFQLKKETYQKILEVWQKEEQKFQEADTKQYPDPFRGIIIEPEKEEE